MPLKQFEVPFSLACARRFYTRKRQVLQFVWMFEFETVFNLKVAKLTQRVILRPITGDIRDQTD